jgi:threonine dehydratase
MYVKSRRPSVRVIGVEPVGADSMWRSLEAGRIVALDRVSTIADGLAASSPGTLTFAMARRFVDEIVRVDDEELLRAIRLMFELEHVLTEPAGAAGVAGLLRLTPRSPGERVVVIVSGANVSGEVLARALKSP